MTNRFGFTLEEAELCPGTVGVLIEDTPKLTTAHVRPFIWSILLYRGAVHSWEVVNALSAVCGVDNMRISDDYGDDEERTQAQICTDIALAEMVMENLLEYNEEKDIWVLRYSAPAVPAVIKAVAGVNGSMPKHFLLEMGRPGASY